MAAHCGALRRKPVDTKKTAKQKSQKSIQIKYAHEIRYNNARGMHGKLTATTGDRMQPKKKSSSPGREEAPEGPEDRWTRRLPVGASGAGTEVGASSVGRSGPQWNEAYGP